MSNHTVDQGVAATLHRVKRRIEIAQEDYEKPEMTLRQVEMNIRQSIHALREVRKRIIHSGEYQ